MFAQLKRVLNLGQAGLVLVILLLLAVLYIRVGTHTEQREVNGQTVAVEVHNFYNPRALLDTATEASFFAIMAVGATMVIISGGIDLSVGSIYALSAVLTALALRAIQADGWSSPAAVLGMAAVLCLGIGLLCGLLNGAMVVGLRVHPFIITMGAMLVFRGMAAVVSGSESIHVPPALTEIAKSPLGLRTDLRPIPLLLTLVVAVAGALYLNRTVMGRHIYAVGGNADASRFAGLSIGRITLSVYVIAGLTAGLAALLGSSYYGAAACADAEGYELFVIASAVVGGASLSGGRGSALGAVLGALLIVLIRQSIRLLHFDANYTWVIVGASIVAAVFLDQVNARLAARRLARAAGEARDDALAVRPPPS